MKPINADLAIRALQFQQLVNESQSAKQLIAELAEALKIQAQEIARLNDHYWDDSGCSFDYD